MENNTPAINQILEKLKDRHRQVDNLMSSTKEMEKAIEGNDVDSLGMLLSMRQKSMDKIDELNLDIKKTLENIEEPNKDKIKKLLNPGAEPASVGNPLEADIFNTNKMTMALIQKIITLDQALNQKVQKNSTPNAPAEPEQNNNK